MAITLDTHKDLLIFGINKNEEIIQFNRECEKITGYSRDEVLGKKIFDFLISKDEAVKWEKILDSIRKDTLVGDIILPFLTKNGSKISISCSTFPVELSKAEAGDICFVGKLVKPDYSTRGSSIENSNNLDQASSEFDDKNLEEIFSNNVITPKEKENKQKNFLSLDRKRKNTPPTKRPERVGTAI